MASIVNLTSHDVVVVQGDRHVTIKSAGVARRESHQVKVGTVEVEGMEVTILRTVIGDTLNLPAPAPDTFYVVSRVLAQANPDRDDLLVPESLLRDRSGSIIGCTKFGRI
jgi:hypothetical protein